MATFLMPEGAEGPMDDPRTDAELVEAAKKGDLDAYGALVERHREAVVAAAYHMVGDLHSAEDAAQEAFVEAFRKLRKLREPGRFRTWLFSILRRKCRRLKRKRREEPLAEPGCGAHNSPPEEALDVRLALDSLPARYREVLVAKHVLGLSYAEIARALRTSEGNVRVLCFRATERLRQIVEGEG